MSKQQQDVVPKTPFFVMNHYYLCKFGDRKDWPESIQGDAFDNGKFKKDAIIIDVECRKFDVIGARKTGWSRGFWGLDILQNLFLSPAKRFYSFEFLTGKSEQLTFEEAQKMIIEHICNRRWANQSGATPSFYRKMHYKKKSMAELLEGISCFGQWPF